MILKTIVERLLSFIANQAVDISFYQNFFISKGAIY